MPTKPKDGPFYGWLKRHAWLITLATTVGGVMIAAIALLPKDSRSAIAAPAQASAPSNPSVDPEERARVARQERAQALYEVAKEKHPEAATFMFADYEAPKEGFKGWVYFYSATRARFIETDRQSCSYPDATDVITDYQQRFVLVSCGFPHFVDKIMRGDKKYSNAIVVVRFFDSDRKVNEIFACDCETLSLSNLSFDAERRTLDLSVTSDGEVFGGPAAGVVRYDINDDAVRARVSYDESWVPTKFERVRR